ncbi:tetratricopeptide repeat protein [Hyphomonas johnsonii]|uniref:Uncharacterized protein n=1 Tax=Hyphomonas johnsonii MHS-2 TaxID=1280950 RepID=A0A059FQ76_9PROT|nr:hypothetical protein [Hyphomonas johnsonii]KCZ92772.1 hypothetical protein HJO_07452 [Hyphomonas johnsonii MHS-2]
MSRAKTSLAALALAISVTLASCASKPTPEEELQLAMAEATKPAPPEEVEAANRADPLTKANFWAKEHAKNPENLATALAFANALRDIGSDKRAIDVLSQVMVVHPNEPELLLLIARALSTEQDYAAAAQAYFQVTRLEPTRADAWAGLGTALDRLDRHVEAQDAYDHALAIDPARTSTLANYGLSLALSGDLAGAEAKLRLASDQPDATTQVRENLALVLGLQGKYDEMKSASGPGAPQGIVEQNVELLREMVQPNRTWEALAARAQVGELPPQPALTQPATPPEDAPVAAATVAVSDEPIGLTGAPQEETSGTGLRLRKSTY